MLFVDHILVLIFAVGYPVYSAVDNRRYIREIKAGKKVDVAKAYLETSTYQWIGLALLAVAWFALARPAADLGLIAPGGRGFYFSLGLLALACLFLIVSWRSVKKMTTEEKAEQVETLGDIVYFLPRTPRDHRAFIVLSVTAGIVEEIIYRGFLIWYLVNCVPLWGAVILSSIVFGFGHEYQGVAGIIRTALVGLLLAVLYVLSGSIWISIIGHSLFDILQGRTIQELFCDE
jgi:membrane protease YdiL (CAAX protease family)